MYALLALFATFAPPQDGRVGGGGPRIEVPAGPDFEPHQFYGTVTKISEEGITIKQVGPLNSRVLHGPGWFGLSFVTTHRQDDKRPPVEFLFYDALHDPKRSIERTGEHEVTDVKVGDRVLVFYQRPAGPRAVSSLHIIRRPGGKVPPANYDDVLLKQGLPRVCDRLNAYQFVEEKGVPKLLPRLALKLPR